MKLVFLVLFLSVASLHAAAIPAQSVERYQKAALLKYPALAQAGSPINQHFVAIVSEKRKSNPGFFNQPDWPVKAADAAAEAAMAAQRAAEEKVKADAAKAKAELEAFKKKPRGERDQIISERMKAEDAVIAEKEWEAQKPRWIFDRLVFGDTEDVIVRKLSSSKILTARVAPSSRVDVSSRYRWTLGESKFNLEFEMKGEGLAAINFECMPEPASELDGLIRQDWDKLRAAAIEMYGPPTKSVEYPTTKKLTRLGITVTDVWERPGRPVALGLNAAEGKCNPILRISDPASGVNSPGL